MKPRGRLIVRLLRILRALPNQTTPRAALLPVLLRAKVLPDFMLARLVRLTRAERAAQARCETLKSKGSSPWIS